MDQGKALLAAVIADPEDDAVRLVYADWLDDNGQSPRAEFIRTQIRREGLKKKKEAAQREALEAREEELVERHAEQWLSVLPEWARPGSERIATPVDWFGYRRGFLQGIATGDGKEFLRDVKKIYAAEPVTHLYLSSGDLLPKLGKCPEFLGMIGLRFGHYTLGDFGTKALAKLPVMPRLRHLWIYKNEMGDPGLRALAKWPGLATVEDLELGFNDFQSAGIKALLASPYLDKLKRLDLSDSLISDRTKAALRERFGKVVDL